MMRIAWIQPLYKRCGIRIYGDDLRSALEKLPVEICPIDIHEIAADIDSFRELLISCSHIHIQYDPSFLIGAPDTFLKKMRQMTGIPIIVSLHEVYASFPGIFPRESIRGGILGFIRRRKYDAQHPWQTIWREDLSHSFHCDRILVHTEEHRQILTQNAVDPRRIILSPYPVAEISVLNISDTNDSVLNLAASGFINSAFNYSLLIETLSKISRPWHFTWIGGLRSPDQQPILDSFISAAALAGIKDRITITGWVDEVQKQNLINTSDIILALFTHRSSSGSICAAIGCHKPILATRLPLTEELEMTWGCCRTVSASPGAVVDAINRIADNVDGVAGRLINQCKQYSGVNSLSASAQRLIGIYEDCVL